MSERTQGVSTTAGGGVRWQRGAGPQVRIDDPVAPRLLSWRDGKFAAARVRALLPALRAIQEHMTPGGYGYIVARVHHMDAIVRGEVAAGLDRIVILGAGYDTRAYRMRDVLAGVQVVEVDLPATSSDKRARLVKGLGSLPAAVTYVEVDFTGSGPAERLVEHGHELSVRTLFVLSGVALLLPRTAVFELRCGQTATQRYPGRRHRGGRCRARTPA
jgi:methyltransferase (TIGR00027 family)